MTRTSEPCDQAGATAAGARRAQLWSQTFLRGLIDGMRCGIVAVDRRGKLVLLNDLGAQILDIEVIPPRGTPIFQVLDSHPQLAQVLLDSFTMVSLPNRAELDLRPGTDDAKTIGFTVSLVPGGEGQAEGSAVFFKDLTRIEHREEQERLRDRLAALGQMAASMAHEVRNPLASIEVTCSLIKRRLGSDPEAADLLGKITAEVRRLNETITSSLEYVRPVPLELAVGELQQVLDEASSVACERCGKPGLHVASRIAEPMPAFLMDRDKLRQVFENLIINAMEAVDARGIVTVEAKMIPAPSSASIPYQQSGSSAGDAWPSFEHFALVRVSDTGPGIIKEKREKIFFPFYTTKTEGSGVGLAMAKKIVNSHRGLIDVDDAPEGGALFTVKLPMALSTAED